MQIWTGKNCRFITLVFISLGLGACSTSQKQRPADKSEIGKEVSLKSDNEQLAALRKEIPDEIKKSNDRLAEMLNRWKEQKLAPEALRSRFSDEIRKMRNEMEKKFKRSREDFQRKTTDARREFQSKQKEDRNDFVKSKPTSEERKLFFEKQNTARERFNADARDERNDYEEGIKDQRKSFEEEIANKWTEFRQEFPEYTKLYKEAQEAKKAAQEEKERLRNQPSPIPQAYDVNKGGDGWPATDPDELNQ